MKYRIVKRIYSNASEEFRLEGKYTDGWFWISIYHSLNEARLGRNRLLDSDKLTFEEEIIE